MRRCTLILRRKPSRRYGDWAMIPTDLLVCLPQQRKCLLRKRVGLCQHRDARLHELGDLLFAVVNLARWMKLDPEEALRTANRRWIERYGRVEDLAARRGVDLAALDLAGKDELWDAVKHQGRG